MKLSIDRSRWPRAAQDAWQERAAIVQFDSAEAPLTRSVAERVAEQMVRAEWGLPPLGMGEVGMVRREWRRR